MRMFDCLSVCLSVWLAGCPRPGVIYGFACKIRIPMAGKSEKSHLASDRGAGLRSRCPQLARPISSPSSSDTMRSVRRASICVPLGKDVSQDLLTNRLEAGTAAAPVVQRLINGAGVLRLLQPVWQFTSNRNEGDLIFRPSPIQPALWICRWTLPLPCAPSRGMLSCLDKRIWKDNINMKRNLITRSVRNLCLAGTYRKVVGWWSSGPVLRVTAIFASPSSEHQFHQASKLCVPAVLPAETCQQLAGAGLKLARHVAYVYTCIASSIASVAGTAVRFHLSLCSNHCHRAAQGDLDTFRDTGLLLSSAIDEPHVEQQRSQDLHHRRPRRDPWHDLQAAWLFSASNACVSLSVCVCSVLPQCYSWGLLSRQPTHHRSDGLVRSFMLFLVVPRAWRQCR